MRRPPSAGGLWDAPLTSLGVMPPEQIREDAPSAKWDPATGLFTGIVSDTSEGRMAALSPSRVAIISEMGMRSPLRDNVYKYRFTFASEDGTPVPVTAPDAPPLDPVGYLTNAYGAPWFGEDVITSTGARSLINSYQPSGTATDLDTVEHLAAYLQEVSRSYTVTKIQPANNVPTLSLKYRPAIGEVLTIALTWLDPAAAEPDYYWTTACCRFSVTSSLTGLLDTFDYGAMTGDDVDFMGTYPPGAVGDLVSVSFGEGARTYTANADGSLTIAVKPAFKALEDVTGELGVWNYWSPSGLALDSSPEIFPDASLPARPADSLPDWDEGLIVLYDITPENHLEKAGYLWLYEDGIENLQMIPMGSESCSTRPRPATMATGRPTTCTPAS